MDVNLNFVISDSTMTGIQDGVGNIASLDQIGSVSFFLMELLQMGNDNMAILE
ncbi:hypothetical protein [Microbulbifer sp. JMSA003]|uniref:hypothetical protein n=1 Tax=Microbulbifer sp. JMSA003 TaxID=3243369 RepID=UPI00403A159E